MSDDGARLDAAEEAEFAALKRREELKRLRTEESHRQFNQILLAEAKKAIRARDGLPPVDRPRPRGRSRWTDAMFADRWAAACLRSGEPYTYVHVAPEFEWLDGKRRLDADPDYLGRLWRKHGGPAPAPSTG